MDKFKENQYYIIRKFMVSELGLKGLELSVYAIIYGFTKYDNSGNLIQEFNGSLSYLQQLTCASNSGIRKVLNSLINKKLIVKKVMGVNKVAYATKYTPATECNQRGTLSVPKYATECTTYPTLSSTNNIIDNIEISKRDNINHRRPHYPPTSFLDIEVIDDTPLDSVRNE